MVTHKPIWILAEIAMGLLVAGDAADYSLCESISAAKCTNTLWVSLVMRTRRFGAGGQETAGQVRREC